MADGDNLDPDADCFKPPAVPTEVHCLHCHREFDSYLIEWRIETGSDGKKMGFWCCPTPGCGGKGFGFDLLPTDPHYEGPQGQWIQDSDDEDDDDSPWEAEDEEAPFHDPTFDAEKELDEILQDVDENAEPEDEDEEH